MPTAPTSPVPVPTPMDTVAAAAQETWRGLGQASQGVDWSVIAAALGIEPGDVIKTAVGLPQLERIECVLDDRADMRHAGAQVRALLLLGGSVNVLLPRPALGP